MVAANEPKRILITGVGRWPGDGKPGLGASLAYYLADQGHTIVINYRSDQASATRLARTIRERSGTALPVRCDVTDTHQVELLAETIQAELGGLDVLINNAGGFVFKDYRRLTTDEWEDQLASTASATFYVSQAMLPMLRRQAGRIINISDAGADRITARPRTLPYHIGKMGVLMITKTMARAEAEHSVTVNALLPGVLDNSEPLPPAADIPAGRHGTAEDILAAVNYLLSDQAGYTTGSFIQVGGGWNL